MKTPSVKVLLALAAFFDLVGMQHSKAASTTLTGGDPTGGLTLTGTEIGAIYATTGSSNVTLQGYTFSPFNPNAIGTSLATATTVGNLSVYGPDDSGFSGTPPTATTAGFTNQSNPSANDNGLLSLISNRFVYDYSSAGTGSININFSGITAGATYDVTFLTSVLNYSARTQNLAYSLTSGALLENGGTPASESIPLPTNGIVATTDSLTASLGGSITASFTPSNQQPVFNAVIITEVPEPTTVVMLLGGLFFLGFLGRRRFWA